ncbi:MAG TPA: enoyl-CoA hydratase/isomerase family protein, partial [Chthonomonadales bacterium]|nr:enoyl-CoA hydratase/isomerase family protein [Chthonomonadales bacterium]
LPLEERLPHLWELSPVHDGGFLQEILRSTLGYIAEITPEVADRIVEVDNAFIDGFGWEMGPFHMLDALSPVIDWPEGEPPLIVRLHEPPLSLPPASRNGGAAGSSERGAGGKESAIEAMPRFYVEEGGRHYYFDFHERRWMPLLRPVGVIVLKDLKKAGKTVEEIDDAALVDLGDDVLCLEWRTKMNTLHPKLVAFFETARLRAEEDFAALIIGGSGEHFSAGYDLRRFLARIEIQDWDGLDALLRLFQDALIGFKYATIPVIGTAYGYTLGGGCETMLHCTAAQAAFESAIGLPEANVGLIPAGGGTTQMLLRVLEKVPPGTLLEPADPYPVLQPLWETLRTGRFSSCADDARQLGFLRLTDGLTRHPDRLLHDAKTRALTLVAEYTPPARSTALVMGESGLARFRWELHLLRSAEKITEHDARVAEKLAYVLTGGALIHPAEVTEQHLLDLEREAFLQLAGTPETLARIKHLLEKGKPLRN